MGLVVDAGLNVDAITTEGDICARSFLRQGDAISIYKNGLRNSRRGEWFECIRALEVVVMQGWFVDLADKGILVGGVGNGWVEVFWAFCERAVESILVLRSVRVGVIWYALLAAAA